jgi:predicted permease
VALVSLGLGVGANTAVFTLVNAVLLRPLPVEEPGRLVSLAVKGKNDTMLAFSYPNYIDFRDRSDVLEGLIVHRFAPASLSRNGVNERIWGFLVSGNYFDVLGVKPIIGRTFLPEEDRTKLTHPVIIISHSCWRDRFGGDQAIAGREVMLNGRTFQIIGVAPEGFKGTELVYTPEFWAPIMMLEWVEPGSNWLDRRGTQNIFATGRLKEGGTVGQAEASLNVLAQQLGQEYPDTNEGQVIELIPPGLIIPSFRTGVVSFSLVLMVLVGLVLLIACTNLASLLLARATERSREIAIRLSLGAGRGRLIRQLLTESLLLSLAGGVAGVLLAVWVLKLVVSFRPPVDFPLSMDLSIDWRVIAFSIIASVLTGAVFGLAPALQATKPDLVSALKEGIISAGYRRSLLRGSLVVAQFTFSLVLLIAAGLVLRALQHLQTVSPGFDPENALMMSVDLGLQGYDEKKGNEFYKSLIERVESLPGVESASMTDLLPLSLNYSSNHVFVEGQPPARGANVPTAMVASVGLDYFETMRIPLLQGRDFTEHDGEKATQVVIVNEAFVRDFFPGPRPMEEAAHKRVSFRNIDGPFWQIVGVVKDGKYFDIGEDPRPFVYFPMRQSYSPSVTMVVRTAADPAAMISTVRRAVQELDPDLPVFNVKTMREHLSLSLFPARIAATLLGAFGLLALVLAAVGIHGVTAYSVARRTREIGIRLALGARGGNVLGMVLRQGLVLAFIGMVIGILAALAVTRLMESVLYGVSSTDALTYVSVAIALIVVAAASCYFPARRASKVDPMTALRYE